MIDLHAHILSGLDDGAKTIEESIRMCWRSYDDGIRTIVATPHILPGVYPNDRSTILAKVWELNAAIKKFGVQSSEFGVKDFDASTPHPLGVNPTNPMTSLPNDSICAIRNPHSAMHINSELPTHHSELPFVILPGADVHFSSDMPELCENGEIVTVNDKGQYLMVEFDFQGIPYHAEDVLFRLMTKGIIPIITHPERNLEIGQRHQRYGEMIRRGCLGQVTAMSLTGGFGAGVKRTAEKLLKNRLVHIIASDTHSVTERPPILSLAVREAEKMIGKEEARKMVTEYPQAILEGKKPNVPEPLLR
jgi:protein-tyrosine phosphatase